MPGDVRKLPARILTLAEKREEPELSEEGLERLEAIGY